MTTHPLSPFRDDELASQCAELFGPHVAISPLSSIDRMGRRITGIDLTQPLSAPQARLLIALLDAFNIISFPRQDQHTFRVRDLERLANHYGAPIPHPKNYENYATYQRDGEPLRRLPVAKQTTTLCNNAFPDAITCTEDADSPAVYVVTNLPGSGRDKTEMLASGLHWHTDIEFEPEPLSTSMFYVQGVPTTRDAENGSWVPDVHPPEGFYHPESGDELTQRRLKLPLNGETAYADTAAAFADLPTEQQAELRQVMVRRRLRIGDPGWLIPLVYTNPRTGRLSLHSPVWASRGKNIAPVEVDGLSDRASREFLDDLERHVLDPKYRYDHAHTPGDVTIWSNFSTLHNAPPAKRIINRPEDARLMYRISCKGEPALTLPRDDTNDWIESNILPPYRSPSHYLRASPASA
ncbi:MAG: TauD/TfdA family dioxygenase [Pseudomonadales bacterium]